MSTPVEVADRDVTGLVWTLGPIAEGTLRGRVLSRAGAPIRGAQVSASGREAISHADGSFVLEHLEIGKVTVEVRSERGVGPADGTFGLGPFAEGTYIVRAYESAGAEAMVENVRPGTAVRIQLRQTGSIAGTVHAQVDDFELEIEDTHAPTFRRETFYRTAGRYHVDDLPPGSYRIVEIDPAGPAARTELAVGDVVTSIDGVDVGALASETVYALFEPPPGTALHLGLARGNTVTVVAVDP